MRFLVIVAALVVTGEILTLDAQDRRGGTPAEEEVRKAVKALDDAFARQDAAALGRIWAEDVTLTAPDGQVVTSRSAALATVNPANMAGLKAVSDDVRIRIYGDVAVVTGRVNVTGQRDGASINDQFRYTDVLIKRVSNWQLVSDQMTKFIGER